ncbi:DUF2330 domain-containing protein [Streptomyces sp. NBC_01761]|uniref:DUF2330 domain-containing protein n=1 Tax=Streptomyces sp. NBC_01761 TaxID=2975932 RepID=UPI003FA3AD78
MQDTVLTDPGLQIGEPFAGRLPQHHRHLPSRQQGDNQPEHSPGCPGPRPRRRVSAHTVLRIRHAAPTLPLLFIRRPRPRTCCETFALRYELDTINPLSAWLSPRFCPKECSDRRSDPDAAAAGSAAGAAPSAAVPPVTVVGREQLGPFDVARAAATDPAAGRPIGAGRSPDGAEQSDRRGGPPP